MKKIKWILFNIEFSNNGIYMIQHLDKMLDLFNSIIENPKIYSKKYENLSKISYEYDWNNVNKKLIDLLNEN